MPWLASLIAGAFLNIVSSLIGRVLVGIGVGVVTYTGVSSSLGWVKTQAVQSFQGLPAGVMGLLSLMHVGSCVSMVFSAMLIRLTLNGATSDTMKSWVKK